MNSKLTIAIAGTGYVGLSNAILLAQHNRVWAVDVLQEKVDMINQCRSPIRDKEIEEYLAEKPLDLIATLDGDKAYGEAEISSSFPLRPITIRRRTILIPPLWKR